MDLSRAVFLIVLFVLPILVIVTSQEATSDEHSCPSMFYRTLGSTGMITSVLGFGFWATFGSKDALLDREGVEMAKAIMRVARERGISLFDNAEAYGNPHGEAERIFGIAYHELKLDDPILWRRSDILITTKLYWGGHGQNENGLSRKHLSEGINASLQRLQLEYVDIVFCHRPDSNMPTETVVRGMSQLVRSGKAMAWGTSEWSAQQITEAYWIAKLIGLEPPAVEQPQYHMFHREHVERDFYPLFREPYNIGTTTFSPLASGLLTGKYNDGIPEGSRLTQTGYDWLHRVLDDWHQWGHIDKMKALDEYAKTRLRCTLSQLAIAWCIRSNPNVSTVLLGASSVMQMEENLEAVAVAHRMTDTDLREIEGILKNRPASYWRVTRGPNPAI